MSEAKKVFDQVAQEQIIQAIKTAETHSSGEIRLHVADRCKGNVLDAAASTFEKLKMHKTALRNGVLFFLSVVDHKFAILGDAGINQKVTKDFWEEIKDGCISKFKAGDLVGGLSEGIVKAGKALAEHFPYERDDIDELSNEISFEDED